MADHDPTTVDLLARALRDTDGWLTGPHSNPTAYYVAAAERIRTALAAAGRLLPEGGQTREEWDYRGGRHRRVITTFPDHSQYRGPWEPVPDTATEGATP